MSPLQHKSTPGTRPPSCHLGSGQSRSLPSQTDKRGKNSSSPGPALRVKAGLHEVGELEERKEHWPRGPCRDPGCPSIKTATAPTPTSLGQEGKWKRRQWPMARQRKVASRHGSWALAAQAHLSKHVEQPDCAPGLPAEDRGDHGVHATAASTTVLPDTDARQHGDQGHQDDKGHQEHAHEHAGISLQRNRKEQGHGLGYGGPSWEY